MSFIDIRQIGCPICGKSQKQNTRYWNTDLVPPKMVYLFQFECCNLKIKFSPEFEISLNHTDQKLYGASFGVTNDPLVANVPRPGDVAGCLPGKKKRQINIF